MTPDVARAWIALVIAIGLMIMLLLGVLDALAGGLGDKGTDALMGVIGVLAGGVGAYLKAALTPRGGGTHKRVR